MNVFQTKQKKLEASHFQWNPLNTSLGNRVKKELTVSTQLPLSLCLEDPTECITPVQGGQYPAPLKGRTLPTSLSSSFPLLLSVLLPPPPSPTHPCGPLARQGPSPGHRITTQTLQSHSKWQADKGGQNYRIYYKATPRRTNPTVY